MTGSAGTAYGNSVKGGRHEGQTQSPTELSPRERQVSELIAEGLTNEEIAEQLHIAFGTALQYTKNIIEKLGARNRTRAAVMFVRSASLTEECA